MAAMNEADHFSGGNLPANEAREWIEMAWAARNAASHSLNGARRAWFDGVKELLRAAEPEPAMHINLIGKRTQ
jgi:hypothetical protein